MRTGNRLARRTQLSVLETRGRTPDRRALVGMVRPADALDDPAEALARIAHQVHLGRHAGLDGGHVSLAEVRHHVPGAIVDEGEDLLSLPRVLADAVLRLVT